MAEVNTEFHKIPLLDELPPKDYVWDGRVGRFRDKNTGQFMTKQAIASLTKKRIQLGEQALVDLINKLYDKKITLIDFHVDALKTIKTIHAQQLMLSRGGYEQTTNADFLKLGRDLKDNHYSRFNDFLRRLKQGEITRKQALARVMKYAKSSKGTFYEGEKQTKKSQGFAFAKRILGNCKHCSDCVYYATFGLVPIDDLIPPGTRCICGGNCRCSVRYYTRYYTAERIKTTGWSS